ncbi:MAG: hypothetical protein SVK08_00525 [Halobacteriota archaeon]|nr:hypothetical protein [Halobacteriota archaeon]
MSLRYSLVLQIVGVFILIALVLSVALVGFIKSGAKDVVDRYPVGRVVGYENFNTYVNRQTITLIEAEGGIFLVEGTHKVAVGDTVEVLVLRPGWKNRLYLSSWGYSVPILQGGTNYKIRR